MSIRPAHARIALAAVVLYALLRLADPMQRWAALELGGDRVEHACVSYLVTLCLLLAFPRMRLWTPALALTGFGVLVEGVQALPGVVGGFQSGDILANAAGTLLASVPIALIRRRKAA